MRIWFPAVPCTSILKPCGQAAYAWAVASTVIVWNIFQRYVVLDGVWLLSSSTAKKIMSSMVDAQLRLNMVVLNQAHISHESI